MESFESSLEKSLGYEKIGFKKFVKDGSKFAFGIYLVGQLIGFSSSSVQILYNNISPETSKRIVNYLDKPNNLLQKINSLGFELPHIFNSLFYSPKEPEKTLENYRIT